jgi:hypothetical protein
MLGLGIAKRLMPTCVPGVLPHVRGGYDRRLHEMLAVLDPVQVPELERLVKSLGKFVFFFSLGKFRVRADPAASVGHDLALRVLDRDADAASHRALGAEPKAKELDELGAEPPFAEVGVLGIEREPEAKRLVALRTGLAFALRTARSAVLACGR